jgi:hypothetical protein
MVWLCGTAVDVRGATENVDGVIWSFTTSNEVATVTGADPATGVLTIPPTLGGCRVARIGDGAFFECNRLTAARIPDSVVSIGAWAFTACDRLEEVEMPPYLEEIGDEAFRGCESAFVALELGESIESLGVRAFAGCTNLREVSLDCRVGTLPEGLFEECENLEMVMIGAGVRDLGSVEGHPFGYCTNIAAFIVGDGVETIPESYFAGWPRLEQVVLPDSLRSIGEEAFAGCSHLVRVNLPPYLQEIGDEAFFESPNAFVTLELGESIDSLGVRAFARCDALQEVSLDCRVGTLPTGIFEGCENLETVIIGAGVRDLGSVEGHPFGDCPNIVVFHVGDGVASIPERYFASWPMLERLVLPDSVRDIGGKAFAGCPVLSHVSYSGNAPEAGPGIYEGTPAGLTSWVKGGSTGWDGNAGSLALPETWQGRSIRRWGAAEYAESGEEVPKDRTETGKVPLVWLDEYNLARDGDYEKAAEAEAANKRPAWACYVAGLDPTDPDSDFRVRLVCNGGSASLEWTPDLSQASDKRAYRVMGKKAMESTEWTEVTDAGDWIAEGWRFFQVRVALPK